MIIYGVGEGCRFEGGGWPVLFLRESDAVIYAEELFSKSIDEAKRIWGDDYKEWEWEEVEREGYWNDSIIRLWQNPTEEIRLCSIHVNASEKVPECGTYGLASSTYPESLED